jgi:hypothetical protein
LLKAYRRGAIVGAMTTTSASHRGTSGRVPRLVDLFDAWVFAAQDATAALHVWCSCRSRDRANAHAVYRAALDREQSAAEALCVASRRRR